MKPLPVNIPSNQWTNHTECPVCRERTLVQIEVPWLDGDWVRGRMECPSPICGRTFRISIKSEFWQTALPPPKTTTRFR